MADWTGAEGVIDPFFAYITANGADKMAAVSGRSFTHSLAMENFQAMRLMDPRGVLGEASYPILLAIPMDDDPIARPGILTAAKHRVLFVVFAAHIGTVDSGNYTLLPQEAAKRLAIRYVIAVREMLKEQHGHGTGFHWTAGKPRYGDTYARNAGEWIADAQLEAFVEHQE